MTRMETRGERLARKPPKRRRTWIPVLPGYLSNLDRMDGLTERTTMATSGEDTQTVEREMTCRHEVIHFNLDTRCFWSGLVEVHITSDDWATWECGNKHTTQFKWEG
ncbi:hypothetical protein [Cryobacterium soli]|uniref:hypothetical protein n=1 Tax=Cryobacterium soli TaxID=2220095 RepID=UPI0013C452A9|nr:hypothetical protein [Cryobacterium soli]